MRRKQPLMIFVCLVICAALTWPIMGSTTSLDKSPRRQLRVALYPYVPQKAEMYWKLEREFEDTHEYIDLKYVDLGAYYYSGQLIEALEANQADVFEIDTVFLRDLADQKIIQEISSDVLLPKDKFLSVAVNASTIDGKVYGVPHWVCGNFLFYRTDDPERSRFEDLTSLDGLERILGRPFSQEQGLLVDLRGKSTLGEKYLDAVLDAYPVPEEALKHVTPASPNAGAIRSLNRLFALCPGGLCDSEKHHESGQFYPKQFAHRKARAFIGYSERMYFVVDEFLNGVREDESAVGAFSFVWNDTAKQYDAKGYYDVDAVSLPLADTGSKMLSWVDMLSIRAGLDQQTRKDALELIEFFNSEKFTLSLLVPEYGSAPRYLLPARSNLYTDSTLLQAAPLYSRFYEIMKQSTSITGPNLNTRLRSIGKNLEKAGFNANTK